VNCEKPVIVKKVKKIVYKYLKFKAICFYEVLLILKLS